MPEGPPSWTPEGAKNPDSPNWDLAAEGWHTWSSSAGDTDIGLELLSDETYDHTEHSDPIEITLEELDRALEKLKPSFDGLAEVIKEPIEANRWDSIIG